MIEVNARNFATQVKVLWIIPGITTSRAGDHIAFHLEAYRSKFGAWREVANRNTFKDYKWAALKPRAIEFRRTLDLQPGVCNFAHHAPLKVWVVADCTNGSYFEEDGRVWVFAFPTRQAARDYVRTCRRTVAGCVNFSAPMLMYQQPV